MAIFLGIDGGGSKTSCLIGDETSILGSGTSAGSNPVRVGDQKARDALAAGIREACTVANVEPSQVQKTCIGLAGAAGSEVAERVRRSVSEIVAGEIQVVGDMVIALQAALGDGPGVIVIAGTGSISYGRNAQGETARAGGWGFAISDEGSGHWIGRSVVAAALRAWDEAADKAEKTIGSIKKVWRLETLEQLVLAANATPLPDFSALFPTVLSLADSGDRIAVEVLTQAGAELARVGGIVIRHLFPPSAAVSVAMSGGVFGSSPLVRQSFYKSLHLEFPDADVNPNVIEPVRGALELARKGS